MEESKKKTTTTKKKKKKEENEKDKGGWWHDWQTQSKLPEELSENAAANFEYLAESPQLIDAAAPAVVGAAQSIRRQFCPFLTDAAIKSKREAFRS